jgi:hypothetical protein
LAKVRSPSSVAVPASRKEIAEAPRKFQLRHDRHSARPFRLNRFLTARLTAAAAKINKPRNI